MNQENMNIETTIEGNNPVIHLWYRNKNKEKIYEKITDFKPYFFVYEDDSPEFSKPYIVKEEYGFLNIFDEKVKKITIRYYHLQKNG